jgi:hypothetical protein
MVAEKDPLILKERILTEAVIRYRTDGIIHITYNKGTVLDVPLQEHMVDIFIELTEGKKVPMLFDAMDGVTITREARDNATKLEPKAPSLATAVIADNLAYRMIANFYLRFNKPRLPYRVFSDKDKALLWLKSFIS